MLVQGTFVCVEEVEVEESAEVSGEADPLQDQVLELTTKFVKYQRYNFSLFEKEFRTMGLGIVSDVFNHYGRTQFV